MNVEKLYSQDLINVLSLMENEIIKDYPTYNFTLEYFMFSLLETRKCAALKILDECIISNNIETLKNIYADLLYKGCITNNIHIINPNKKIEYDSKLLEILNNSLIHKDDIGDKQINTEHVLMAILSDDNIVKLALEKIGIDFNIFKNKVLQNRNNTEYEEVNKVVPTQVKPKKDIILIQSDGNLTPNKITKKSKTNNIDLYTTNLNRLSENKEIDNIIGREKEVNEVIQILLRRNKNNVVIVGESGCGKTSVVYSIVNNIVLGKVPLHLINKEILSVNLNNIMSGTQYKGQWEQRVTDLIIEIKNSKNKYILFFDDIHTFTKHNNSDEVINLLNIILSDKEIQTILITNTKDYKLSIGKYYSIANKLQRLNIEPLTDVQTIEVIKQNKHYYEEFHKVTYNDESIDTCVKLSKRYITDKCLPDSAIELLDSTGAFIKIKNIPSSDKLQEIKSKLNNTVYNKNKAKEEENYERSDFYLREEKSLNIELKTIKEQLNNNKIIKVSDSDIKNVLSNLTGIEVSELNKDDIKFLSILNEKLKNKVIGQDDAIDKVCASLKRNRIGLKSNEHKPDVYLFSGPTGVGKTFLAKQLTKEFFGNEKNMIRLDCSELSEEHSVSKLLGAPSGYVGYGDNSLLTPIQNKPYSLVLFDEVEKAHPKIYNLFLQIFDEGFITDSTGQKIDFSNTIIIMTSNIGVKESNNYKPVGFSINDNTTNDNRKNIIKKELENKFSPEFLNRINQIIQFNSLNENDLKKIIELNLNELKLLLNNKKEKYDIEYNKIVIQHLYKEVETEAKKFGARPILRIIETLIEEKITDLLINNEYYFNYIFNISINKKKEIFIK